MCHKNITCNYSRLRGGNLTTLQKRDGLVDFLRLSLFCKVRKSKRENNMRVLTKRELHIFDVAYECICRVVVVSHTTDKLYEIKQQNRTTKEVYSVPIAILDLFSKAGINKMQTMFCSMNKEQTIKLLIKKLFKDGIQPNSYIFHGLLVIKPIKEIETTYTTYSERESA